MMRCGLCALLVLSFVASGTRCEASPESRQAAVLSGAVEAAVSTVSLIRERKPGKVEFGQWAIYSTERMMQVRVGGKVDGQAFDIFLSGYLWGAENENWQLTYSGGGESGGEPVYVNGRALWQYNPERKDHIEMNFQHSAKFGQNSTWAWIVGSEIVIGGTIGAAGAVVGSAVISAGTAVPAAVAIGAAGALAGASALVTVSNTVKTAVESDRPVSPPTAPPRPAIPQNQEKLEPRPNVIYVGISKEGIVYASGPDGTTFFSGNTKGADSSGTIEAR